MFLFVDRKRSLYENIVNLQKKSNRENNKLKKNYRYSVPPPILVFFSQLEMKLLKV
jgi:hypothetical protein